MTEMREPIFHPHKLEVTVGEVKILGPRRDSTSMYIGLSRRGKNEEARKMKVVLGEIYISVKVDESWTKWCA